MHGWVVKTLDELINLQVIELGRGKVISKKDIAANPGSYPVYSSAKENEGKFGEYGKYMFDEELITWSVDGGGRLFHRPKHRFSVTNVGGTLRILDNKVISYRYLFYCLTLLHTQVSFDWVKKAHPSIIRKLYNDIPLPPLPEQRRIVGILDEAFAGIDSIIANTEQNLSNARELFESYLNNAFTQKTDGWVTVALGALAAINYGYTAKASFETAGPKFLRITDIQNNFVDWDQVPSCPISVLDHGKHRLSDGDIVFARTGATTGKSYLISKPPDSVAASYLIRLRLKDQNVLPEFVAKFFHTREYWDQVFFGISGSAQGGLNASKLSDMRIPIPPLSEQQRIVEALTRLDEKTQRLEALYQQKLDALNELKQSILQKAFRGDLTKAEAAA